MASMNSNFRLVQSSGDLGDPDQAPPADTATLMPAGNDVPPRDQGEVGLGQFILIGGLVLAVVSAFLMFRSLRDGGVRQLQDYDKATRTGLIGGGATLLIIGGLAWYISRQGF